MFIKVTSAIQLVHSCGGLQTAGVATPQPEDEPAPEVDPDGLYEGFLDAPPIDGAEEEDEGLSIHTSDILTAVNFSDPEAIKHAHHKLMAMSKVKVSESGKVGHRLYCCCCPRPILQQGTWKALLLSSLLLLLRHRQKILQHYTVTCLLKWHKSGRHRCPGGNLTVTSYIFLFKLFNYIMM